MDLPTSDIHKQAVKSLDTTTLLTNAARQRDARNYASFPIVDVDCHHYENESIPVSYTHLTLPTNREV